MRQVGNPMKVVQCSHRLLVRHNQGPEEKILLVMWRHFRDADRPRCTLKSCKQSSSDAYETTSPQQSTDSASRLAWYRLCHRHPSH